MKNTKLSVGLIACLLSVAGLSGCDATRVKSSKEGVLLTYTVDGQEHKISADDILEKSYDDSSKYQAIYDIIYSVLVKNYFNREATVLYYGQERTIGKGQMGNEDDMAHGSEGSIYGKANQKVEDDKDQAQTNADANNTRYKKELDAILESKGVSDLDELKEKYVEEIQKETFEKNFYTYYIEDLKLGAGATLLKNDPEANAKAAQLKSFWSGYFEDQLPYHVSHILVKVEDGSGTNYADGTISKANANKLYDVVNALATSEDTFSTIAKQYSEDTGSGKLSGDLGIMDTSTSFVNEFKLGVYAYENYYASAVSKAAGSKIDATGLAADYENAVKESFKGESLVNGVPVIDAKVFTWLKDAADVDKDYSKEEVLDNASSLYPRNIIYNKYLNRHSVAFIVNNDAEEADANATHGYHTYTGEDVGAIKNIGKVLSVKVAGEWRPILCVRAGSDYQGIHFIVVNRSPFLIGNDANEVSQSEYYTTFYPEQDLYPHFGEGTKESPRVSKKTYVNFSSKDSDVSATKKRAEELASKLKSFDSDRLGKYIFKKYLSEEKVVIKQNKLAESLDKWIDTSVEKSAHEREESWNKTWNEYIDTLSRQGSERSKLVPEACRLSYSHANDKAPLSAELYDEMVELLLAEGKTYFEILELLGRKNLVVDTEDAQSDYMVEKAKFIDGEIELLGLEGEDADNKRVELEAAYPEYHVKNQSDLYRAKGGLCNDGKEHINQ